MSYPRPHLNAARRRARKRFLARRDGRRCTYCRVPFAKDLRDASLDHVVPISLLQTWSSGHLVLACRPCNTAKGNTLPLSVALLLCAYWPTGEHPTACSERASVGCESGGAVPGRPTDGRGDEESGERADSRREHLSWAVDWTLLARLAHARQSADSQGNRLPERSGADLPERAVGSMSVDPTLTVVGWQPTPDRRSTDPTAFDGDFAWTGAAA
ncbi:HNH endonuclease [Streptomyces benahoarensis]|nr:HNH endonuclease [Streptomyces benahoarensis]TSB24028.1 HNH endonuclease [Streptomyces benahoarensis]